MRQNILITIYALLFIVFALMWNKERWKRIYSENRLDYCQQIIKYPNNESIKNLYYYGCTRQK